MCHVRLKTVDEEDGRSDSFCKVGMNGDDLRARGKDGDANLWHRSGVKRLNTVLECPLSFLLQLSTSKIISNRHAPKNTEERNTSRRIFSKSYKCRPSSSSAPASSRIRNSIARRNVSSSNDPPVLVVAVPFVLDSPFTVALGTPFTLDSPSVVDADEAVGVGSITTSPPTILPVVNVPSAQGLLLLSSLAGAAPFAVGVEAATSVSRSASAPASYSPHTPPLDSISVRRSEMRVSMRVITTSFSRIASTLHQLS